MRDESQNLMGFCEKSLGQQAGKDRGVAADCSGAGCGHQVKRNAAGATRCSPLGVLAGAAGESTLAPSPTCLDDSLSWSQS